MRADAPDQQGPLLQTGNVSPERAKKQRAKRGPRAQPRAPGLRRPGERADRPAQPGAIEAAARLRTEQLRDGLGPDAPITWLVYKQGYLDRMSQEKQDLISLIATVRSPKVPWNEHLQNCPILQQFKHSKPFRMNTSVNL